MQSAVCASAASHREDERQRRHGKQHRGVGGDRDNAVPRHTGKAGRGLVPLIDLDQSRALNERGPGCAANTENCHNIALIVDQAAEEDGAAVPRIRRSR